MKITTLAKISPLVEMTSPTLLQCKSGVCGGCPNRTGKLLWIPSTHSGNFKFQYNFWDSTSESTGTVKYNLVGTNVTINGVSVSYSNPPDKNYSNTTGVTSFPNLSPASMKGTNFLTLSFTPGGWVYFKQPNPAINNVHDALCFEYNNEKSLITFRSF
jgi:hypothetical protein